MGRAMHKFADKTELLFHARGHMEQAVNSLNRDVKNCLKNELEPAPFAAVLFCFSTINLLGALVTGRADRRADNKEISIYYMTCFMHYSAENAAILIDLFRHKLVHLAQPSAWIRFGSEKITWKHHHHDRHFHLRKIPLEQGSEIGGDDIKKMTRPARNATDPILSIGRSNGGVVCCIEVVI
jgi:hypothetical protein